MKIKYTPPTPLTNDYYKFFPLSNMDLVCIKETSPRDISLTHTQHMFLYFVLKI